MPSQFALSKPQYSTDSIYQRSTSPVKARKSVSISQTNT